jgi:hypothetical protein
MLAYLQKFISAQSQNAILAAVVASFIALVGTGANAYYTIAYAIAAQQKQVKFEAVTKFVLSSGKIVEIGGGFIAALNDSRDLSKPRGEIRNFAATQIDETENLRKFFPSTPDLVKYQDAVSDFSTVAEKTSTPTEMRRWAESLDKVMVSKSILSNDLYKQLGVGI